MRVTVIGTVHEQTGRASSAELLAILTKFRPDVIFLEMPPSAVAEYIDGPRSSLESDAVRLYRSSHPVELVPVDIPTFEREFFEGMEQISIRVLGESSEYRRLVRWEEQYVESHGFEFLNSGYSVALLAAKHAVRVATLARLGEQRLLAHYEAFASTNELRDNTMVQCIESYARESSLTSGVLLVGAGHLPSLHAKTRGGRQQESPSIQWHFIGSVSTEGLDTNFVEALRGITTLGD